VPLSKIAIVFGATGLVGNYVVNKLNENPNYSQIIVFSRRPVNYSFPKVNVLITDFKNELTTQIQGDEIYCCLGTTIGKAGSEEAFRKIDFDLPVMIGKIAAHNKITAMFVVSSLGADENSSNFYLRTKGEMEQELTKLNIPKLVFFRPSMLLGPRIESRPLESIGKILMKSLGWIFIGPLAKYKAIHANTVATVMVQVANAGIYRNVYGSEEIKKMVNQENQSP